jgi:hypothetical protein
MVDKGFISGFPDNTFRPEENLTRAQYAAIISKAFDLSFERQGSNFTDVSSDFWAYDAIVEANRMGFISGFPDDTFRPNQNLTRVQAIVSLTSGLDLTGGSATTLSVYTDRAQIPSYAANAVATATRQGIVVNYPNTNQLDPLRDITRAEVAALIYQALVARGDASAIDSPYIVTVDASVPPFIDVSDHWAKDFIVGLVNEGLISGFPDGTFKPDASMTRAQYAALLVKAFDPAAKRAAKDFTDVPQSFWGYDAVQKAYRGEFLSGMSEKTFAPNENVTRVQVIVSLVNGLGLSGGSQSLLDKYEDADKIPNYGKDEVATATQKQIVVNYPKAEQFEPNKDATRAEVAAMVYQALVDAGELTALNSPYIVSA